MMTLSPRQHAALSVCLTLVISALVLSLLVWTPFSSRAAFHERLDALRLQQQKFAAAAARSPVLEEELAALDGLEINHAGFLEEKPHALAAADLQRLLGASIEETGGSLVSTQVLPDTDEGSIFPEITVKVHLLGSTDTLRRLLYKFSSGRPLLIVDNLLVQQRWRDDERARRDTNQLEIRFDVSAFIYQSDV